MMSKIFISGGDSFTFGHELSDDENGKRASRKTWAFKYYQEQPQWQMIEYICTAKGGIGNSAIARRTFDAMAMHGFENVNHVAVMWTFVSRYDWAMPRHKLLDDTRWATITPWDTRDGVEEANREMANSEPHLEQWRARREKMEETNVGPFADNLYRLGANRYHETYLSWKSIIWLQNILEKHKIPYTFTLADNTLFYDKEQRVFHDDRLLNAMHKEIDFTNWKFFGERMMGFNQWTILNEYERGVTHPLDQAHQDAVKLVLMKD